MPTRALPTGTAPLAATHRFPRHRRSVGRARAALRHQLAIWHIDDTELTDSAVLLLSELTTNAVNATATPGREIGVRFELTSAGLRLEVSDASDEQPTLRHATVDDESGRGLALVEALADTWGTEPRGMVGKEFYGAPILSEVSACVRESGHPGDHRDARGGTWYLIPLVPIPPLSGEGEGAK